MKKFINFFAWSILAVALVGCSSDSDDTGSDDSSTSVTVTLSVSPYSLSFDATGAEAQTITATTNASAVTFAVDADWVSITDNGDNTFAVSVADNTETGYRSATITFTATEGESTKDAVATLTQADESEPYEVGQVYYEGDTPMGVIYYVSADGMSAIVISNACIGDTTATYTGTWNLSDISSDTAASFSGLYSDVDTGCDALFNAAACTALIEAHADYSYVEVDGYESTDGFLLFKWVAELGEGWYVPTMMDVIQLAVAVAVDSAPDPIYDLGSSSSNKNWHFDGGSSTDYYDADNAIDAALIETFGEEVNIINCDGSARIWTCNISYQNTEPNDDLTYTAQLKPWSFRFDQFRSVPLAASSKTPYGRAVKYLYK